MNDKLEPTDISWQTQTPGQIIKAVREAKRISIGEVMQRLLLSKHIINALEEDNYSRIPAEVYALGYLKAYAQFLQIPADTVIKSFRRLNVYTSPEVKTESKVKIEESTGLPCIFKSRPVYLVLLGVVGAVVLGVVVFFAIQLFTDKSIESVAAGGVNATVNDASTAANEQLPMFTTDVAVPEMVEQTVTDESTKINESAKTDDSNKNKADKRSKSGSLAHKLG